MHIIICFSRLNTANVSTAELANRGRRELLVAWHKLRPSKPYHGSSSWNVYISQAKEREERTQRRQQRRAELLAKKEKKSLARKSAREQERKAKQAVQELKKQLGEEPEGEQYIRFSDRWDLGETGAGCFALHTCTFFLKSV